MIRWGEWGAGAFARARAAGKPVLLSLTATWCHACHRMDEETWEDPGVAAAVEAAVVPVRVDADARPDVHLRYHLGGLPSTALLDAEGRFVRGATFLTRPALFAFLDQALGDWKAGRVARERPGRAARPTDDLVAETIRWLRRRVDAEHGGFGLAPKLPEPEALTLLLRHWRTTRDGEIEGILRGGLDAIARGLADQRHGGFFRYAAAPDWTAPHTEKLAVDQGRLIRLFLEAGVALGERCYLDLAGQALAHARGGLADAGGRVFASVAAEPGYYAAAEAPEDPPAVDRRRFADAGASMASAAWLHFAVTGEAAGFSAEYREAAPEGRVPHRLDGAAGVGGLLADQAAAIAAALMEHRLSGDAGVLNWARRATDWTIAALWDEGGEAFRAARAEHGVDLPPMFPILANAEMALALADLADLAGSPDGNLRAPDYRALADRVVASLTGRALGTTAGPALAVAAQRLAAKPPRADLSGAPGEPRAVALARLAVAALGPHTTVRWQAGAPSPASEASPPVLTLCVGDLCLPPRHDPDGLVAALLHVDLVPRGILRR